MAVFRILLSIQEDTPNKQYLNYDLIKMSSTRYLSFCLQHYPQRVLFTLLLFITTFVVSDEDFDGINLALRFTTEEQARRTHSAVINEFMRSRENWNTSHLGSWLFKSRKYVVPQHRTFYIYFEEDLKFKNESLEGCSVNNCIFTSDERKLQMVDAVIVWLYNGKQIPEVKYRNPKQIWIFWNEESPKRKMLIGKKKVVLTELANIFNWSMTYRTDADIPVTYGRTVPLIEPVFKNHDASALSEIIPNWKIKTRDILVTILMSNCVKFRTKFVTKLQKYIPVDMYGKCTKNKKLKKSCPGHQQDCPAISKYLFYLAMENSDCKDYLTEKIWYNSFLKGAIPIVVGPSLIDCNRLLPPDSFIHVSLDNDTEIKELAKRITYLSENDDLLLSFHKWRNHFIISNDHWFFGRKSAWLCRICEGLNYNDVGTKIYTEEDIKRVLDPKLACGTLID